MSDIQPRTQQNTAQFDPPGRGRIYNSIIETIGNTPLVRVPNLTQNQNLVGDLVLKLEFFNPISSVKDRLGVGMILDLEAEGKISPGD
ncbi:Cysteine synthase, partial [hydrothermal vent metagenome]